MDTIGFIACLATTGTPIITYLSIYLPSHISSLQPEVFPLTFFFFCSIGLLAVNSHLPENTSVFPSFLKDAGFGVDESFGFISSF